MRLEKIRGHKKQILSLCQQYGVSDLRVFGSTIRQQDNATSDIDFLVWFQDRRLNFDNFMDLKIGLEDLLEQRVDLVTEKMLHRLIHDKVLAEAVSMEKI
jgi:uncharacterized protein